MNSFKAVLTRDVSFHDQLGSPVTLRKGQMVDVTQISCQFISFNTSGKMDREVIGDFVGSVGNESFDLHRTEFKTLD